MRDQKVKEKREKGEKQKEREREGFELVLYVVEEQEFLPSPNWFVGPYGIILPLYCTVSRPLKGQILLLWVTPRCCFHSPPGGVP